MVKRAEDLRVGDRIVQRELGERLRIREVVATVVAIEPTVSKSIRIFLSGGLRNNITLYRYEEVTIADEEN